jgi:DNA primase
MTISELKKYIYEKEKIEYILEQLNCHHISYHDKNDYYSACFPDGDNIQGINIRNNEYLNYRSFSRNVSYDDGKDLISLVEYITKKNFIEAVKYLHSILGLEYKYTKKSEKPKEEKPNPLWVFEKHKNKRGISKVNVADIPILDEEILDTYVPLLHIDWYREAIMPWTREKFGLAYSYKHKRVVIPLRYWLTGELLGTNQRTTIENYEEFNIKKYFITPTYPKHINLFGLYENHNAIQKAGYVVVAESEKSCLKRDSLCDNTVVSLSGKTISDEQIHILIGLNVEVVIALDKDVDINEIRFICEKFYRIRNVSYIYDKWDLLKDKQAPMDATNKIYNFLFKHRIKYDETEHKQYLKSLRK